MSRAERRLAATELSTKLRSQLELWQSCTARLNNLEEQMDVCWSLQHEGEDDQPLACVPLQRLLAKKVDYHSSAQTVISRFRESLDLALSLQAEETHVERKLRKPTTDGSVKSKRKKNKVTLSSISTSINLSSIESAASNVSDVDSSYSVTADIVPDVGLQCLSKSTVSDIDEVIAASTKTPLQLCTLINKFCKLLELVVVQTETFLNLIKSNPNPSDRTGSIFEQIEKSISYDQEVLLHLLDEYIRGLASTKSKAQNDRQDESLNDDSCNYTLDF